jgi:uncharacterized OsmC-like protein
MTSKVTYLGNLRTSSEHLKSGNSFITDAPTDNNGKGEAFSPTDTVATALGSCMLTVMGIKAQDLNVSLDGSTAEITKIMASNPRRISEIKVVLRLSGQPNQKHQTILENTGRTCPVLQSLHPDLKKDITFIWDKQ